ncbi:MAG: hypothetical protein ACTTKX_08175 [Treponema sp.]
MLECARTSSCAGNLQNLRYYLVKSQDTVEAVQPYLRWAHIFRRNKVILKRTSSRLHL